MGLVIIILILAGIITIYLFSTMQEMKLKKAEEAVEQGDLDVALNIFMDSLKKNPKNIETLWHLGNINEEKGNFAEAIGYYNQILALNEKSSLFSDYELYKRTGLLYREIKKDREALDYLLQALQYLPSGKEPPYHIAMILMGQSQYYRALSHFEKAMTHYAQDGEFRKYYGLCCLLTDNVKGAIEHFEESNILTPGDNQTKFMLAYAYMKEGAHRKSRETMEDVINANNYTLNNEQLFFAIKLLFISYCMDKNFEVSRDLHIKMENLANSTANTRYTEDVNMAFIYMRYLQGYFDLALDRLNDILNIEMDMEGMSQEDQNKVKQNKSHLFDLLSILNKYKDEKERARLLEEAGKKVEVEFSILENKAREALTSLQTTMEDWKDHFLNLSKLTAYFIPQPAEHFDPSIVLDKYSEENMQVIKKKMNKIEKAKTKPKTDSSFKALGVDPNDPCQSMKYMDFPSFVLTAQELADRMGYKVINQAIKLDPVAYSEGQGTDFLCEEKLHKEVRVLFVIRRWTTSMGYILITNLKGRMAEFKAKRIVLISTAPLSDEAKGVVEKDPTIDFYTCEDIAHHLI